MPMVDSESLARTITELEVQVATDHNAAILAAVRLGTEVEQPSKPGRRFRFDPFVDPHFPWTDGRDRYTTADLPYPLVEVIDDEDETVVDRLTATRGEDL